MIAKLKNQFKAVPVIRQFADKRRLARKFATEVSLLKREDISKSNHPSIIHYSLNKSATQYVKKILSVCV